MPIVPSSKRRAVRPLVGRPPRSAAKFLRSVSAGSERPRRTQRAWRPIRARIRAYATCARVCALTRARTHPTTHTCARIRARARDRARKPNPNGSRRDQTAVRRLKKRLFIAPRSPSSIGLQRDETAVRRLKRRLFVAPRRPNPIGLTLCRLEGVAGDTLLLSGVDLVDGTPAPPARAIRRNETQ